MRAASVLAQSVFEKKKGKKKSRVFSEQKVKHGPKMPLNVLRQILFQAVKPALKTTVTLAMERPLNNSLPCLLSVCGCQVFRLQGSGCVSV